MSTTEQIAQERAEEKRPYNYAELERIADRIANLVAKELEDYYVRARVWGSTVYVDVGTPFAEISEAVAESLQNAYYMSEEFREEVDSMSEEEIEELFEARLRETLEEINSEYAIHVRGRLETPKYVVEFSPLECSEDYCVVGLLAEIEFRERVEDIDIENIAQLIATVFRL